MGKVYQTTRNASTRCVLWACNAAECDWDGSRREVMGKEKEKRDREGREEGVGTGPPIG